MSPPDRWPNRPHNERGIWLAIEDLRERIDGMQVAEEVRQAVREELEREHRLRLTRRQKWAAAGLAVFVGFLPNLAAIVHLINHHLK